MAFVVVVAFLAFLPGIIPQLAESLQILIKEVQSEHPEILSTALATFGATKLDFVDCLLAAYNNHLGDKVVTFDRKLNRLLQ